MNEMVAMAKAVRAISDLQKIDVWDVPGFLAHLWEAWEAHPDFDAYYDEVKHEPRIYRPVCVAIFRHEPGAGGHNESYIFADLQTLVGRLPWGKRTFGGEFHEFHAIEPHVPVSPYFIGWLSYSYHGSGKVQRARMELKRLLPADLHKLITAARRHHRRAKHFHVAPEEMVIERGTGKVILPERYATRTKQRIFIEDCIEPADMVLLDQYIDPDEFYRAATGKYKPEEVAALMKILQPGLFGDIAPIRAGPARIRKVKTPAKARPVAAGQTALPWQNQAK